MIRELRPTALILLAGLTISLPACRRWEARRIKKDFQAVDAQLAKHLADNQWIDDDPQSPKLLARQWALAGEWFAAWLDSLPSVGPGDVKAAMGRLLDSSATTEYLALNDTAFLVAGPGPIGNVFIVAKSRGHYRLAWSIAQTQGASGEQAEVLAAWRAENAVEGGRGPYWAASGCAGPVFPGLGRLPNDAKGRARFYIDGSYAQAAGMTVGAQISVWVWDGVTAHVQVARDYITTLMPTNGTRFEGDILTVRQKQDFRSFLSAAGPSPGRQVDWIVRITPVGIEDLGERSAVPQLDAVDELLDRVIHGKPAADLAAPAAVDGARRIVATARAMVSDKEWKDYPTVGMLDAWKTSAGKDGDVLCLVADSMGAHLFRFRQDRHFITSITETTGCEQ